MIYWKQSPTFLMTTSLKVNLVKTKRAESNSKRKNTKSVTRPLRICIFAGLFFRFCFKLGQFGFSYIISDGIKKERIGRNWKHSNSCDSDFVELMAPLTTTPIEP